jgi:hypothetical protein
LRHPSEDRDLEVRLESEGVRTIDAAFFTADAAKILAAFYTEVERDRDKAERLLREIEAHRRGHTCFFLHRLRTSFIVPEINWEVEGPIVL